jgi:hypothetical protein
MTLSDESRAAHRDVALRRMLDVLGDQWIGVTRFEIASADFCDLPQTTWLDLQEEMYLRPDHDSGGYGFKLTGDGLIAAMRAAGALDDPEHKRRCVVLKAAFKDIVKGRELSGASVDTLSLVAQTGLTEYWIWNALDARFLAREWPNEYVDVESRGREVRIPANFAMRRPWGTEAGPILPIPEFRFPKRS